MSSSAALKKFDLTTKVTKEFRHNNFYLRVLRTFVVNPVVFYLRQCRAGSPFHTKLFEPPAILQRGSIRAAQVQLLGEIERQLFRAL